MTWMTDAETFYRERDAEIRTIVQRLEIVTHETPGHTVFRPEDILEANEGEVR